jgi:hypothetical protein
MAGEEPKGNAPSTTDRIETAVSDQLKNINGYLDEGINIASDALKSSTALVKSEIDSVTEISKVWATFKKFTDLVKFNFNC